MREDAFYAKCGLSAECDGDGDGGDDGDDGDGGCILRKVWAAECRVAPREERRRQKQLFGSVSLDTPTDHHHHH